MTQTVSRSGVPFLMARDVTKKVVRKIGRKPEVSKNSKSTQTYKGIKIQKKWSDIAGSYEGQSPSNPRLERDESIDSTVRTLHNVTTPKTNIIHDKSKYGGT